MLPAMRPCYTPATDPLRCHHEWEYVLSELSQQIKDTYKKKQSIMFFIVGLLFYTDAPFNISLNNWHHFTLPPCTTRKRGGGCKKRWHIVRMTAWVYGMKGNLPFLLAHSLFPPMLCQDRQLAPLRQRMHTNGGSHPPLQPQSGQKWQPAALRRCVALVPLTSAAGCASTSPRRLYTVGGRGLTVPLLYSCGLMSVSQRTGRTCAWEEYIIKSQQGLVSTYLWHIESVKKGLLFYVAFPDVNRVLWHQSVCHYYAFRGKKFTSISWKCAPLSSSSGGWYCVS